MSMAIEQALEEGRNFWDQHARRDPLWAILSEAKKRDGKWEASQFFESGVEEVRTLLFELGSLGIEIVRRRAALDFGCGVGRLTQALAPHFDRVIGVDISASMQELAAGVNRFPERVSYVCNQAPNLDVFAADSFDFILSSIVLQHVQPEIAASYIREFCRVLAPGGLAVFQLPSHRRRYVSRAPIAAAMPDGAYKALLHVAGVPAAAVPPGTEVLLDVDVTNLSAVDWARQKYGMIRVGNHWFDSTGNTMLVRDDGRTSLPGMLRAGETCRLPLMIKTPLDPGRYQCEIDLVHEGVAWYQGHGSTVARLAIRTTSEAEGDSDAGQAPSNVRQPPPPAEPARIASVDTGMDDPGNFPMHGRSLESVLGL